MKQQILYASENYKELDFYFSHNNYKKIFLVCDSAFNFLSLSNYFNNLEERLNAKIIKFNDFQPNPLYESVVSGVELFNKNFCDCIVAIGGGSSIDVAKCIKLYSNMNPSENYLKQKIVPNTIPFLAIPTTAGTGSEATRYAVIYYNGEKQSVSDYSCIPSTVLFDSTAIKTLPEYQKKSTLLDALCHSIESFWSVNSTDESKEYASASIKLIFDNIDSYLNNEDSGNSKMLEAANLAGKAINITQTTAGHAMCYKLTSLYKIAHGHAASLCVSKLWPYMIDNTDKCIDPRGKDYLDSVFNDIATVMNCSTSLEAVNKYQNLLKTLNLQVPEVQNMSDFDLLKKSVNPVRLINNPVELTEDTLNNLYHQILGI